MYGDRRAQPQPSEVQAKERQQDHRDELVARLSGQVVKVPDMGYIYKDWSLRLNPSIDVLREHLEEWFEL